MFCPLPIPPSSIKSSNRGVLKRSVSQRVQMLSTPCAETPLSPHPASQTRVLHKPATLGEHRGGCRAGCGRAGQPRFRLGGRQRLPNHADTGRAWRRMPRACPAGLAGMPVTRRCGRACPRAAGRHRCQRIAGARHAASRARAR